MADKVTTMVLKVDHLECPSCYKKIKKILCKFPQIRDQVYDEKQNTVKITVVSCSPEKIRDKLCCKGGKTIKSIEIKEPQKTQPAETEKSKEKSKKSNPEPEKTTPPGPATLALGPPVGYLPVYPVGVCCTCGPCYEGHPGGPCHHGYGRPMPCYDGCGCGCGCGCGRNRVCYVRCDDYFSKENTYGCTIM